MIGNTTPEKLIFHYEFSTGSREMFFAVLCGFSLATVGIPIGLAIAWKEFSSGSPAGIFGLMFAGFLAFASIRLAWDWYRPKAWSLSLSETCISWQAPDGIQSVPLNEIKSIKIANDPDVSHMWITLLNSQTRSVHPNCLGSLEILALDLHEHVPRIQVDFSGPGWKRLRQ